MALGFKVWGLLLERWTVSSLATLGLGTFAFLSLLLGESLAWKGYRFCLHARLGGSGDLESSYFIDV